MLNKVETIHNSKSKFKTPTKVFSDERDNLLYFTTKVLKIYSNVFSDEWDNLLYSKTKVLKVYSNVAFLCLP